VSPTTRVSSARKAPILSGQEPNVDRGRRDRRDHVGLVAPFKPVIEIVLRSSALNVRSAVMVRTAPNRAVHRYPRAHRIADGAHRSR